MRLESECPGEYDGGGKVLLGNQCERALGPQERDDSPVPVLVLSAGGVGQSGVVNGSLLVGVKQLLHKGGVARKAR